MAAVSIYLPSPGTIPGISGSFGPGVYSVDFTARTASYVSAVPAGQQYFTVTRGGTTYVVAASNASTQSKASADYLCTGTNDDLVIASALSALPTAGGKVLLTEGTFVLGAGITMTGNQTLEGQGMGATIIQPAPSFVTAQMIIITGNQSSITNLQMAGQSTTYTSNPATNAIQITGATGAIIQRVFIQYMNGWAFQSTATSQANFNTYLETVRAFTCAKGFHLLGVTGSSYNGVHWMTNCYSSQTQAGDCLLIEDISDVVCTNLFSEVVAGTGSSLHIKGPCNAIQVSNVDLGPFPGPSTGPTVLIEADGNGSPNYIVLRGGIIEGGTSGINITGGNLITLQALNFYNNGTFGVNITGGDAIQVKDCTFEYNGSAGTTGRYDLQSTVNSHVTITGCYFYTAQGSTAQKTNNAVNITTGAVTMTYCAFYGTGYNSGNIFAATPTVIRQCTNYNPLGNISISVPASGTAFATKPTDLTYYVTGGTVTVIAVAGTSTGLTSGTFRVPATQTFTITYSVAPTVSAFSD